jgi:hypothetical protein
MNRFRYWLADLISGGALTRLDDEFGILFRHNGMARGEEQKLRADLKSLKSERDLMDSLVANNWQNSNRFSHALRAISAEVKPTSNATVMRMGRIAEEALQGYYPATYTKELVAEAMAKSAGPMTEAQKTRALK